MKAHKQAYVRLVQSEKHRRGRTRYRNPTSIRYFFRVLLLLNMAYAMFMFGRVAQTLSASVNRSESGPRWDATWAKHRTIIFTALWSTHKLRNIAIYFCVSSRHLFVLKKVVYYTLICPDVFYDVRYDILFEAPKTCLSHSCLKRYSASHYVYAEFVLETFEAVIKTTISPPKPLSQGRVAVLVEPRQHPLLEYTVKQVMLTLGPTWSLQIFVSSTNEDFVRKRMRVYPNETGQNIILTSLRDFGLDDLSKYGNRVQSAFSAHEGLYKAVLSEHILWFQVDVIMRSPPEESWLQYAYVGAEWKGCEYPRLGGIQDLEYRAFDCDATRGGEAREMPGFGPVSRASVLISAAVVSHN